MSTAWKVSKYGDFSGPYFPAFGRISPYSVRMQENTDQKKIRIQNFSSSEVYLQLG